MDAFRIVGLWSGQKHHSIIDWHLIWHGGDEDNHIRLYNTILTTTITIPT